ncbi:MAG: hypothetical protein H7A20_00265 [Rhodanobacteraceae bacterium]|nr:hypothetical protein [Rhodanobacteraceae bacterium]
MAKTQDITVPDIGGYDDVPVIEVLVAVGDRVEVDQGLVTLESDKATMEMPSSAAGIVRELKVKLGDTVSEGSLVAVLEVEGADALTGVASPEATAAAAESRLAAGTGKRALLRRATGDSGARLMWSRARPRRQQAATAAFALRSTSTPCWSNATRASAVSASMSAFRQALLHAAA